MRFLTTLVICVLAGSLAAALPSGAQGIPVAEEGARLSEQFTEPAAPLSVAPAAPIQLETTTAPAAADTMLIHIRSVTLSSSTIYDAAAVHAIAPTGQQPLSAVYAFAEQLTARYSDDGYFLSRVIVPPQALDPAGADIILQAVEGWIDEVVWPAEVAGYRDFFSSYADRITLQRPLNIRTLERYLLLASDLPGLDFGSTLEPSPTNSGASRLVVTVERKTVDAFAATDNHGTEGRGPYQFSAGVTVNNALRFHERLSGTAAGSFETSELLYGQLRYEQVLNTEGLTAAVTFTADGGKPGTSVLRTLLFDSRSLTWAAELRHPLVRSRSHNLMLFASMFANDYQSDALNSRFNEDRLRGVRTGFSYDRFDQWNGVTQVTATVSQGIAGLGSTGNTNLLASRANGRVDFTKVEATVSRFQQLNHGFSLVGRLRGQYAANPLLASEECGYGGNTFGRGFTASALVGDHCFMAMTELRYDIPSLPSEFTQAQLFGFADYGKVWRRAPAPGAAASVDAASAGLGARISWQNQLDAEITAAKPLHGAALGDGWRGTFSLRARY
ncbi:MAG: hypothetical protein NXH91_06555 [Phyllobacteriaceae bacterium]|nr:hypothetical protein [Phyllobacteriaceae bacterium]